MLDMRTRGAEDFDVEDERGPVLLQGASVRPDLPGKSQALFTRSSS
jgi:hypothetical protein